MKKTNIKSSVATFFKELSWKGYLTSSVIVSVGALILYSQNTLNFNIGEYLIWGIGMSWGLVFVFMIFFTLLLKKKNKLNNPSFQTF